MGYQVMPVHLSAVSWQLEFLTASRHRLRLQCIQNRCTLNEWSYHRGKYEKGSDLVELHKIFMMISITVMLSIYAGVVCTTHVFIMSSIIL